MADFKIPNLCGASPKFNAIQTKFESMMTSATDGLEVDASTLKNTLDTDVTALVADLKAMIPELPALPDINLQAQLTSLSSLIPGSGQHKRLFADITTKFGSDLTAGGFSLDTLVSDAVTAITGGTNLCSAVPNFTVPAAGGGAVEKAVEVLQAAVDSEKEIPSVQLANANFTAEKTAVEETFTSYEKTGEEVPTEDIGPYRVAEKTTKIVVSDNQGSATTIEATTPKNSVGTSTTVTTATTKKTQTIKESGGTITETKRSNVAKKGFTVRVRRAEEEIREEGSTFALQNTPAKIHRIRGSAPALPRHAPVLTPGTPGSYFVQVFPEKIGARVANRETTDVYTFSGKEVTVTQDTRGPYTKYTAPKNSKGKVIRPTRKGVVYIVSYSYYDNYDPNFAGPI